MTICPRHRAEFGIRWRSHKVTCSVPMEIAAHQSEKVKGTKAIVSHEAAFIFKETGKCIQVGMRK